jgi:DNA-binding FadR family transcriptional regulator
MDQWGSGWMLRTEAKQSSPAERLSSHLPAIRSSIRKQTVKDLIADKLGALIGSGVVQTGEFLPGERELAAILGVSRESIRGAVQTLASRGIVEVSQGSRTRVVSALVGSLKNGITSATTINSYDLESVHRARLLVEREVVADAAARIGASRLARLETLLVTQREMLDDPVAFLMSDREFHTTIYRAAANRLLADFVVDLYTYVLEYRRIALTKPGAIRESYEDHRAIVAALRAGAPAAVVAAFGRHIQRIYMTTIPSIGHEAATESRRSVSAAAPAVPPETALSRPAASRPRTKQD